VVARYFICDFIEIREKIIRESYKNRIIEIICEEATRILAYADDIVLLGNIRRDVATCHSLSKLVEISKNIWFLMRV